jgi:predicted aspartyl protease
MSASTSFTVPCGCQVSVLKTNVGVGPGTDIDNRVAIPQDEFVAIWDTGATASAISQRVVDALGLTLERFTQVWTAGGMLQKVPVYYVDIRLPNRVIFRSVRVTRAILDTCDLLIGMDIIGAGDFAVTNLDGKTTFSYRHPSAEQIDFTGRLPKRRPRVPSVDRNDPCPCKSGKKHKNCCGK